MSAITVTRPTEDAALANLRRYEPTTAPLPFLRTLLAQTQKNHDRAGARLIHHHIARTTAQEVA
jgi:hypothetical protein